jgi:hypothetical protein
MAHKIKIEIRKREFGRGMAVRKALVTERDEETVSVLIAGEDAPAWAFSYAKAAAEAGEPGAHIADTIMVVYDLATNGRQMESRYDGRCVITGERFDAGAEIFYSFDSKSALVSAVVSVLNGKVPSE